VRVDSLEETEDNPEVDGDDVQVLGEVAVDERAEDGTGTKNEHFGRMGILCRQTKWSAILVMNLMNVLVQHTSVQCLMSDEVEEVFEEKEQEDLGRHGFQRGERDLVSLHSKLFSGRVEEEDKGEFDGKM
jgi:hypothetical protein